MFVSFLHFLQKYRCVPKIGFSADISIDILIYIYIDIYIDIFIDISIDISIYIYIDIYIDIFIDISIDILTDIFIDIFIDILTDIFIDILTDKEGGGRKERKGVDLFLKSNNPTPTGGEQAKTRAESKSNSKTQQQK